MLLDICTSSKYIDFFLTLFVSFLIICITDSEYSTSTAQSTESRRGSFGSMSDSPLTVQNLGPTHHLPPHPNTLPLGGEGSNPTAGSDRGYATDSVDGVEEEAYSIPHRREWLSLRVHTGNKWKSPFSCLNSPVGMDS